MNIESLGINCKKKTQVQKFIKLDRKKQTVAGNWYTRGMGYIYQPDCQI